MEDNLSASSSSSVDSMSPFVALQSIIKSSGPATIASRIHGVPLTKCSLDIEKPLYGSYSLVYVITFSDGIKWVAPIPRHGVKKAYHESDAKALEAQALTMRFIKQNTSIPVPDVVYYDTMLENELGAPFILMTWLDGKPVQDLWRAAESESEETLERRENILRSTARAMGQLRFFSAQKLGELEFEPTDTQNLEKLQVKGVRSFNSVHLEASFFDNPVDFPMFTDLGPFEHTSDLLHALERDSYPVPAAVNFRRGERKLLQIMIDAIPTTDNKEFFLTHPDYSVQNFLFDKEGSLTGILDWDGVTTSPRCLGYARYPSWITRDWDPLMYGWKPNVNTQEDSPETLRKLRQLYHRIIKEELGEDEAKSMINSHLFEAIHTAASNPFNAGHIIRLLAEKCILKRLFEIRCGDGTRKGRAEGDNSREDKDKDEDRYEEEEYGTEEGDEKDCEDPGYNQSGACIGVSSAHENEDQHSTSLWLSELYVALDEGRVSQENIERLRKQFENVFGCTEYIVE